MFRGSYVALVTPFFEDGSVDYDALVRLVEWHIECKTDGLVLLGTTGESSTMTHEEDEEVVRRAMAVAKGKIQIIAGAGSNCTQTALEKSLAYERLGVDGLLLITPYYNKANARGMIEHFRVIADRVHTPIILYHVPGRTGCNLPEACVQELSKHKNIVALKEASGNISYVAKVARYISDDFQILSGNDDMIVPVMSLGGSGVISVWGNICPRECRELVHAQLSGDHQRALEIQLRHLDLINQLFVEVNPIPVKQAMQQMGLIRANYRLPLCPMDEKNVLGLVAAMKGMGL